jgi:FkbM family methyltransferase
MARLARAGCAARVVSREPHQVRPLAKPSESAYRLDAMESQHLAGPLFGALLRAAYRYEPGVHHNLPYALPPKVKRDLRGRVRERLRDIADRAFQRARLGRPRVDLDAAALRLATIAESLTGLERTWTLLEDDRSKALLVDLLCFRLWGPSHVGLPVSARQARRDVTRIESDMLVERNTVQVADPFVPSLGLYEVPRPGGPIRLNCHPVTIEHIFLLEQYAYRSDVATVAAQPGDVVIDGGACWGDTALYFADRVGLEGRVHAFEFSPGSLEILRRNLALNASLGERVEVVPEALWDSSGASIPFGEFGQLTSLAMPRTEANSGQVLTSTLDEWCERAKVERVDFIKLDVEGAELRVLKGSEATLRRDRPTVAVCVYHEDADLVEIPEYLAGLDLGYKFFLGHYTAVGDETVLFAQRPSD